MQGCTDTLEVQEWTPSDLVHEFPATVPSTIGIATSLTARDSFLAVGDRANSAVHLFTTTGVDLGSFGRSGEGPGEIGLIGDVEFGPGDSIYIGSTTTPQVEVYSVGAGYSRTFMLPVTSVQFAVPRAGVYLAPAFDPDAVVKAYSSGGSSLVDLPELDAADFDVGRRFTGMILGSGSSTTIVVDAMTGRIWSLRDAGPEGFVGEVRILPDHFWDEFAEERGQVVKGLPSGFTIPLVRHAHVIGDTAVWLDLPWENVLGALVPLAPDKLPVLVRPSPCHENRESIDSTIIDGKLYILYPTKVVAFRLAEA